MKRVLVWATTIVSIMLLYGCGERPNDGRMVEKFISRLNAREYSCASQYIFPGDHPKLKLYAEVMTKNPDTFLKLISKENSEIKGKPAVKVVLECVNPTPYFRNYMEAQGVLHDNIIEDTWEIKETAEGKALGFNWAKIKGENLMIAHLAGEEESIPVYKSPSRNSTQINAFNNGDKVIINNYPADSPWLKCYKTDDNCRTINGYIDRASVSTTDGRFFKLSIFDTLSLLLAVLLFVVFGVLFFLIRLIVEALLGTGFLAWIIIPALILSWLYVLYQLLEKILFELFIINLPY
ncbi:MAG: hypothetical protein IK113_03475 [Bacteroidales bacterium]|jgi:hypothetical protein|nr:hypothetical protein [Bacteroidales bacterium]